MTQSPPRPDRVDVEVRSGGERVAAWFYPAVTDNAQAPCVVMAHGFSLTRADGLAEYAERFAAEGAHVIVFDHRYLGDSGGSPRQRFRIGAQQQDWRSVIAYASSRPEVDPRRIVLWGYSFAGGHVTSLLGKGELDVLAAMVLCPFADGLKRVLATPLRVTAWIVPRAILDVLGRHVTIPVTAPVGGRAAMAFAGEADGFAASVRPGSGWRNHVSPGVFLTVGLFRPVRRAARIRPPLWVGRCVQDITVDAKAVGGVAAGAPHGELHEFGGDHFAPFTGESTAGVIDSQVAFLRRVTTAD
ncbi:MAG: alpha/beta hydrolase [Actinomycetota bacterium]|nr:alpha/beta hydrolase [Actinomycetota bacterium]